MRFTALPVVLLLTCAVIAANGWFFSSTLTDNADDTFVQGRKKVEKTASVRTTVATDGVESAVGTENLTVNVPEVLFIGTEDLCVRVHNNTAFEGVEPYDTLLLKNAYECQKACVASFPRCVAVMFYFIANQTNDHLCYQFDQNSLDADVQLIPETPKSEKDVIRALEIVYDCHQFDPFPPLGEDGVVTSSDKVPRSKRESGQYLDIETQGPWSGWGKCMPSGVQARSQACEYGRKIQRRGCPARNYHQPLHQPQQHNATQHYDIDPTPRPAAPVSYPPQPYNHDGQRAELERQRADHKNEYARRQEEYKRLVEERYRAREAAQNTHQLPQPPQGVKSTGSLVPTAAFGAVQYVYPQVQYPACRSYACVPATPALVRSLPWSAWSSCSCSCGDGIRTRRRYDKGVHVESQPCNLGPCATWSEWCEWSDCHARCGKGKRSRERYCLLGAQRCEGDDYESLECDAGPCPEWSKWEDWSQCSTSCGHGTQYRQRTCLGGAYGAVQCIGEKVENRPCDHGPCSFWGPWQEWSACSASCGDGAKTRSRTCLGGTDCFGESNEEIFCFGPPCAGWTPWTEWSPCSATCGPGQRTRERSCQTPDGKPTEDCIGDKVETLLCNEAACATWSEWCDWSPCDRECGGGISFRGRVCEAPGSHYGDYTSCSGPDRETRSCNTQACAPQCQWTEWCPWSTCSAYTACDSGVSLRSRQCVGEPGCSCHGLTEESQQCHGKAPCPPPPPPVLQQPC